MGLRAIARGADADYATGAGANADRSGASGSRARRRLRRSTFGVGTSCIAGTVGRPRSPGTCARAPSRRCGARRCPARSAGRSGPRRGGGARTAGRLLRPVAAGRHRVVRALDVDRHDRDAVLGRSRRRRSASCRAAVTRPGALGEHQQVPALVDQLVDVLDRAVADPAAVPRERHRVEDQRDALAAPRSCRSSRRRRRPRCAGATERERAQDRRRVEVARVVGDQDHRVRELAEDLAPGTRGRM